MVPIQVLSASLVVFFFIPFRDGTAQAIETCRLQDGRRCQHRCAMSENNTVTCSCYTGYGLESDNITCTPILQVDSIYPTFGPAAGGTFVTITGKNMFIDSSVAVRLASDVTCHILWLNSTNTTLIMVTPWIGEAQAIPERPVNVAVFYKHSKLEVAAPVGFIYKPNPVVQSIHPRSSILRGGIELTVTGKNMMSVVQPKFNIHAIAGGNHSMTFTTNCTLGNSTTYFCPSPDLSELTNFFNVTSATSNDVQYFPGLTLDGVTDYDYNEVSIPRQHRPLNRCYGPPMEGCIRGKGWPEPGGFPGLPGPQTCGGFPGAPPLPPSTTPWYPSTCTICGKFVFHPDPIIHILEPEKLRFRPIKLKYITIKGEDLDRGLSQSDYKVFIGDAQCENLTLYSTRIICFPPIGKPKKPDGIDDILITVQIGILKSNRIYVGKFNYEENLWHHKPARSGFIALIVIFLIIVIIIIAVVILAKKSKQKSRRTAAQRPQMAKPGTVDYWFSIKEYLNGFLYPQRIDGMVDSTQV